MNGNLMSFWTERKRVECTCSWSRQSCDAATAKQKFVAHAKTAKPNTKAPAKIPGWFEMPVGGHQ